jgi:hypothetical protein
MTERLMLLLFILLNYFIASGQRILTGRVIDSNTNKGIKEAQVRLNNGDTTVVSNSLGFFQIKADTSDNILIAAPNYEVGKVKVPNANNFKILLVPNKEEIWIIVEEPSHPSSFDSFKEYLSKGFSISTGKNSGYLILDFVTDLTGEIYNVIVLENSFDKQVENTFTNLLTKSPNWEAARQRGVQVKQKHRIKVTIDHDKIEDVMMMRPNLNPHSSLTMYFMQNLRLPKHLTINPELFEMYLCFEYNKCDRTMDNIKLINCADKELEKELLRVIIGIPYQLIYDFYPENTKLVQPILLFVNSDTARKKVEIPTGELQKEIIIRYGKH